MGINDGEAAGQTMGQLHFHIIPRYHGDTKDPRGGIRWIIPNKAEYWD
ncbi:MAG: HIT domain-containing protein [Candidatus Brocadia sinica]|nr:HIT domain-containing protein [Candidatus Brocadia sinica]NUO04090.1 HIT domain-containing protein [Candidatus Brocadia sinica]